MINKLLNDHCIFCKSNDSKPLYPVTDIFNDRYTLHQCNQCRAIYLSPYPTEAQLNRAYDDTYYGEGTEKFNPIIESVLDLFRLRRSSFLRKQLNVNARVLDIGCGNGRFLQYLSTKGNFELHGIEREGNSARRASQISGIRLLVGSLNQDTYSPNYFDAITLFHVFEHIENPAEMLHIIENILKPGGVLVMSFPNMNSHQAGWFKGDWLHLDPPRHLFYFKPIDFIGLMQKKGFELAHEQYISLEQNPYGLVQSILNKFSPKRELLFEFLKGNKSYIKDYPWYKFIFHILFFITFMPVAILSDIAAAIVKRSATVQLTFIKK
jgi:2-polyprenyl-3-methyl-5-hydroxy-6-metoxy-1,4-benzoquinol methylase